MNLKQFYSLDTVFIFLVGIVLSYALLFRDLQSFIYIAAGIVTSIVLNFIPDKKALIKILLTITIPIAVAVLNKNIFQISFNN